MSQIGHCELSLTSKPSFAPPAFDQLRRRLAALESGAIIVWALTPLIVAAVIAVS